MSGSVGSKEATNHRDMDSSYARLHGIEDEEEDEESRLAPVKCPRCKEENSPNAKFCHRCGMALSVDAAQEIEEDRDVVTKDFTQLAKEKPEILDDMQEFMQMLKLMEENEEVLREFKKQLRG